MSDIAHQQELNELAAQGYFDDAEEPEVSKHDTSTPEKISELYSDLLEQLKDFKNALALTSNTFSDLEDLSAIIDEEYPDKFVKLFVDFEFIKLLIITTQDYIEQKGGMENVIENTRKELFKAIINDARQNQETQTE